MQHNGFGLQNEHSQLLVQVDRPIQSIREIAFHSLPDIRTCRQALLPYPGYLLLQLTVRRVVIARRAH